MASFVKIKHSDIEIINRLWTHLKIAYFLLAFLWILFLCAFFILIWHVSEQNAVRCHYLKSDQTVLSAQTTELQRVKRNFIQPRASKERGTKKAVRGRSWHRNESHNDDWVWMSSFSRIPSDVMQDFCASTKDYCPPGFPGRPGPPGRKGDAGKPGENGVPGKDGFHGKQGFTGAPGNKGESGIQGPPGHNGTVGLSGKKGSPGEPGSTGRRGEKGDKGDKGDVMMQARNCTCPQGPKGSKGEPGYVTSDSLVSWVKDYQKLSSENNSDMRSKTSAETQVAEFD